MMKRIILLLFLCLIFIPNETLSQSVNENLRPPDDIVEKELLKQIPDYFKVEQWRWQSSKNTGTAEKPVIEGYLHATIIAKEDLYKASLWSEKNGKIETIQSVMLVKAKGEGEGIAPYATAKLIDNKWAVKVEIDELTREFKMSEKPYSAFPEKPTISKVKKKETSTSSTTSVETDLGEMSMTLSTQPPAVPEYKVTPACKSFADKYISIEKSDNIEDYKKLLHPQSLACINESNKKLMETLFMMDLKFIKIQDPVRLDCREIDSQKPRPDELKSPGMYKYPVRPNYEILIEWDISKTKTESLSSSTRLEVLVDKSGWHIVYPCIAEEELKKLMQMF